MKTKTETTFRCDHCNKLYLRKHACILHEKWCYHNPENRRPCFDCNNLVKRIATIYFDTYNGEHSEDRELLYCRKIDEFVYPPKVEAKGNAFELEEGNSPMPKTCEHKKSFSLIDPFENM